MGEWQPGERYVEMQSWDPPGSGIWAYLGWQNLELRPGYSVLGWEPNENHSFPAADGWIVHGGMVTTLLDTAMGNATWSLLNSDEVFLTADLRTEFFRPTFPGMVRAVGAVVHKTRRITFATADLFDSRDRLLASARATNITIKVDDAAVAEVPDLPVARGEDG